MTPADDSKSVGEHLARMCDAEAEHAAKQARRCGVCLREDLPTVPMNTYPTPLKIKGRVVDRVCTACMGELRNV